MSVCAISVGISMKSLNQTNEATLLLMKREQNLIHSKRVGDGKDASNGLDP